jgi:U4/U6.U5 tri-snRNP-associated protein 3
MGVAMACSLMAIDPFARGLFRGGGSRSSKRGLYGPPLLNKCNLAWHQRALLAQELPRKQQPIIKPQMSQRDSRGGRGGGGRGRGYGGGGQDRDRRERDDGRRGGEALSHSPLPRRTRPHHLSIGTGQSRARSRSPRRDGQRAARPRSPPRGPRREHDREERTRERDERPWNPTKPQLARTAPKPSISEKMIEKPTSGADDKMDTTADELNLAKDDDEDPEEAAMRKLMGFGKFRSTKNTKVPGNDKNYAVRKEKKTEYRQYMNRTGGFNRPLSPG